MKPPKNLQDKNFPQHNNKATIILYTTFLTADSRPTSQLKAQVMPYYVPLERAAYDFGIACSSSATIFLRATKSEGE